MHPSLLLFSLVILSGLDWKSLGFLFRQLTQRKSKSHTDGKESQGQKQREGGRSLGSHSLMVLGDIVLDALKDVYRSSHSTPRVITRPHQFPEGPVYSC